MRIEYVNVNTNKLHDELIANGIVPTLVESLEENTWITFDDNQDMIAVQAVIDAHNPEPVAQQPTVAEQLMLAMADLDAQRVKDKLETQFAIAELTNTILGGALNG